MPIELAQLGGIDEDGLYWHESEIEDAPPKKPRYCKTCGGRLADSNKLGHHYMRECWPKITRHTNTAVYNRKTERKKPTYTDAEKYVGRDGKWRIRQYQKLLAHAQKLGFPDVISAAIHYYKKTGAIKKTAESIGYHRSGTRQMLMRYGVEIRRQGGGNRR